MCRYRGCGCRQGESTGRPIGFELFDEYDVEELAETAAQRALTKLNARPAPSGAMPVVIGCGGGGVLFHEACGHGLEADLVKNRHQYSLSEPVKSSKRTGDTN